MLDALANGVEKFLRGFALILDLLDDLEVGFRVDGTEREIFEFRANLTHAETMSDGGVNVERLLADAGLLLAREAPNGAQIVETIAELDEDDADVADHRQQHLADAFGLLLFTRVELDLAELGDAVDADGDFVAEALADLLDRGCSILNDVV